MRDTSSAPALMHTTIYKMSTQRSRRKRRNSDDQGDDNEEDTLPERVKEIAQCVLASHSRRGGIRDNEASVKKVVRDAVSIAQKQMQDVLGCKLTKDGDRLFINYEKQMPKAARGETDLLSEAKQGLLSIVLTFIHMTKNPIVKTDKVKEFALWEFLEMLEVSEKTVHPVFGLPSKLIAPSNSAEFISQGWLSFEKRKVDRDSEEVFYDWGPRAIAVINPMEILEVFCEIMGEKAEEWKEHFNAAKKVHTSSK